MSREEGERALDEAGDRRCLAVVVELDEGEPRVVVDDRVRVVVADPGLRPHPVAAGLRAIAGRRGGQRSGTNRQKGRTKEQLYNEAKRRNIPGRSKMNKRQLQRAVDARK